MKGTPPNKNENTHAMAIGVFFFFLGGGGAALKGEAALYGLPSMLNHSTGSPVDIQVGSPN